MYSIRFFVGFIGTAAAAPMAVWLHARTGSLATATLVMADLVIDTFRARWRSPTLSGGTATRALGRCCCGRGIDLGSSRGAMPGHVSSEFFRSPVKVDDIALSFHFEALLAFA
jgi:hypothetical protein